MDTAKIVAKMNAALERELHEVVRYMHQSFWVKGPRASRLRAFFREQSRESMGHATTLGELIVSLGGRPVVKILEIYEPGSQSDAELLKECVHHEEAACEGYKRMLPLVDGEPRLKRIIAGLAREEGEHIVAIRRMAERIARAGTPARVAGRKSVDTIPRGRNGRA
ncbi:MAG: ferritin-like domain-containing protein [bacterium]